jgi:hypothetical protein
MNCNYIEVVKNLDLLNRQDAKYAKEEIRVGLTQKLFYLAYLAYLAVN